MGWTGPIGNKLQKYENNGIFQGQYVPYIIVTGSNGSWVIPVEVILLENVEEYVESIAS